MYVKLTSNGTMSESKYDELLACGVSEIAISLDGVRGNQLPYAHVGPKVLQSIGYLNDKLPRGKKLVLNITISNRTSIRWKTSSTICTREFRNARLWLNPVVVGEGKLRVATEKKVNPEFLRRVKSPTLVNPRVYAKGCEDYYKSEIYNWGCLAGEFFFDIKPNGDFWICQDHPSKTPLNVLDPDFDEKYRNADFSNRRECSGCTYSCYWMPQKAFQPSGWEGLASMWWKASTSPDEPCRQTEQKYGWVAGLAHYCASRTLHHGEEPVRSAAGGPTCGKSNAARRSPAGLRDIGTRPNGVYQNVVADALPVRWVMVLANWPDGQTPGFAPAEPLGLGHPVN